MFWSFVNKIVIALIFMYIFQTTYSIYKLFSPVQCDRNCINYSLKGNPKLQLMFFTSTKLHPPFTSTLVDIVKDFNYNEPFQKTYNLSVPISTQRNGSLFLHSFLMPSNDHLRSWHDAVSAKDMVYVLANLTDYRIPTVSTFQLLMGDQEDNNRQTFSHLKSEVFLNILTGVESFSRDGLYLELSSYYDISSKNALLPIMIQNSLSDRISLFKNTTNRRYADLTINYSPINIGKLRLTVLIDSQFSALRSFGFSQKDIDEVKGIFADTNVYLLCITVVVAFIHLILDTLAFKNDVLFWKNRKSMVGLSLRAVIWRAGSQVIVFLYLLDEEASLLVLIPAGIATIIEFWKLQKVAPIDWRTFKLKDVPLTEEEISTRSFDKEGMHYLSYVLYPLCIAAPVYSLLYLEYKSWYSWVIHSLVNCVYAFGFLFMLPQLFINYKLKSVAHLPWKAFMYKAFNTFIDDLFAFIIHMPTAHRLACFRDDIVFVIYLYQRWLYPVDSNRLDEAAASMSTEHVKKE